MNEASAVVTMPPPIAVLVRPPGKLTRRMTGKKSRIVRQIWWLRLWLVIAPVRLYQVVRRIPGLNANVCRFQPTCSQYMIDAVVCHGLIKGVWAGSWRILRCNPFGKMGDDPAERFKWYWEQAQAAEGRAEWHEKKKE